MCSTVSSTTSTTDLIRIAQILTTMIIAAFTFLIWKTQQKKLRESNSAQDAIKAQIALRLQIEMSKLFIFNSLLLIDKDKTKINNLLNTYRTSFETKFIDLIQKLTICELHWGTEVTNLRIDYESNYKDLQIAISKLQIRKLQDESNEYEKKLIDSIISKLINLEENSSILKVHLI